MKRFSPSCAWLIALSLFLVLIFLCLHNNWNEIALLLTSMMGAILCSSVLTTDADLQKQKNLLFWEKKHIFHTKLLNANYEVYNTFSDCFLKRQDLDVTDIRKLQTKFSILRECFSNGLIYISPEIAQMQEVIYKGIKEMMSIVQEGANSFLITKEIKTLEKGIQKLKNNLEKLTTIIKREYN